MSHHRFRARNGFDAEGQRSVALGDPLEWNDPVGAQDFVPRDWILERANYTALAGRVGDLPVSTPTAPLRDGTTYLIKYQYNGEQLSRLAVWDSSKTQVGGIEHITADVDPADVANIIANAGRQFPGEIFEAGNRDAEFEVTYNGNGTLKIDVTNAGTGYRLGDVYDHNGLANLTQGVHFIVDRLTGVSPTGGWRYVDIESWVKPLRANADVATDQQEGDFQSTTETDHKELKIWHNNAWITLFSEDTIKGWIAALSLFEGTVEPEDGTSAGAIKFDALPDLQLLTAASDRTKNSHYWTYVGAPNFVVHSEYSVTGLTGGVPGVYRWNDGAGSEFIIRDVDGTHAAVSVATLDAAVTNSQTFNVPAGQAGAGSSAFTFTVPDITKPGTPMIGADLDGAILNPGDWVQIADRGTGGAIDLHWVTVGGDLLAKARGDKLFGLQSWVDGGWEQGSLVVHNNTIYRAKQGVVGGDAAPGAGTGTAQKSSVFVHGPVVAGTQFIITIDGNGASYTAVAGDGVAEVVSGLIKAVNSTAATVRLMAAGPHATVPTTGALGGLTLTGQTPGTDYDVRVTPAITSPTGTNALAVQTDTSAVAPTFNKWEKLDLSGGVRWVMTDGDLPATAPAGELYFVLASPQYGGGAGALVYWDGGANKWQNLGGGSGGQPLDLSGGLVVYPRTYYMTEAQLAAGDPEPAGRVRGDMLVRGNTGHVKIWNGTSWKWAVYSLPFDKPANAGKLAVIDAAGSPALSDKTFDEEFKDRLAKYAPSVGSPPESAGTASGHVTTLSFKPIGKRGSYRQIRYVDKTTRFVMYVRGTGFAAGSVLEVKENMSLLVGTVAFRKMNPYKNQAYDMTNNYAMFQIATWDNSNLQKETTMAHLKLDYCRIGTNYHFFYQTEYTRQDGQFSVMTGELFIRAGAGHTLDYFDINAYNNEGLKYVEHF